MTELSLPANRRLRLHPARDRIAALAARHIAAGAGQGPQVKVAVPPNEDFVIHLPVCAEPKTTQISVLRSAEGRLTVFSDRLIEIELIGTESERAAVIERVSTKTPIISIAAIRRAIKRSRRRRSALSAYQ